MIPFRRERRRRRALEQPFPATWRHAIERCWPTWAQLTTDERVRIEALIRQFVPEVRWEAAQGFAVTEEMQAVIAAQACLLVLELGLDHYRKVGSIIVHPRTVVLRGERRMAGGLASDSPFSIAGQAHHRGPVLLAWSTVAFEARHPDRGNNVVFHEFAHQLDMLDGTIDGTPPLQGSVSLERWVEVCTAEYERLRHGEDDSVLRAYGAVDPGEFFAVATETFFTRPVALAEQKSELYDLLSRFYRQDPADRVRRSMSA
ncbi:MAG: zinc-dependent peptidase [Ilumatobacteraceae bacterium]